jgi:hypothetical protein
VSLCLKGRAEFLASPLGGSWHAVGVTDEGRAKVGLFSSTASGSPSPLAFYKKSKGKARAWRGLGHKDGEIIRTANKGVEALDLGHGWGEMIQQKKY